ncbi:MAG TPA: mandelate racemase/muconate lactonizing enzyme family protein [Chloroflexota bacterium]
MKIVDVRSVTCRVPVERPTAISTRKIGGREYVVVWIDTDAGVTGVGYTYAGTVGGRATEALVVDALRPLLLGEDPTHVERHWAAMYQETLLAGRRGAAIRAISAVDIALWDLLGKLAGLPLYRVLGARADEVPAYASGGYYRDGDPVENVRQEMAFYKRLGFTDFKMKVGGAPFEVDVARVRAARETIGPSGRLALDANNAWKRPDEALRFARAVEGYDIWWLEEPLSPEDVVGHAELARTLDMAVATGEIHATRWDFRELIERGAADILQPDAGVLGGVSEWMKVAHAAATFNLPVAPHWHANIHVHLVAAVANGLTVEYFVPEEDIYNFERLVTAETRLRPREGRLPLSDRPGLGIELDEAAVARFQVR